MVLNAHYQSIIIIYRQFIQMLNYITIRYYKYVRLFVAMKCDVQFVYVIKGVSCSYTTMLLINCTTFIELYILTLQVLIVTFT